jgi:hypothetical protein
MTRRAAPPPPTASGAQSASQCLEEAAQGGEGDTGVWAGTAASCRRRETNSLVPEDSDVLQVQGGGIGSNGDGVVSRGWGGRGGCAGFRPPLPSLSSTCGRKV